MTEWIVQMEHVQKTIADQVIIEDFNLQAASGQVIALCGGNGAGKSTLLRMLAGIIRPTAGKITVCGLQWQEKRMEYASKVGYMPDDYRFSAGLTALETMQFWAKLKGLPRQRATEVLSQVGLSETGRKPVTSFSKGMRQRIMFAQAMLAKPPLLLMDEPTNGLDPYWMDSFVRLVRQIADEGTTIIFSTHMLEIAEALADRIVFLRNGKAEIAGTPEQIRQQIGSDRLQDAFRQIFGIPDVRR